MNFTNCMQVGCTTMQVGYTFVDTDWVWHNIVQLAFSAILLAIATGILVGARCLWEECKTRHTTTKRK
jgi:hypothetical protein